MQIVINMRHTDKKNVSRDYRDPKRRKFPTKITIKGLHNHAVNNADALRELRVNPVIKVMFDTYFELGKFSMYVQLLMTQISISDPYIFLIFLVNCLYSHYL